MKFITRVGRSGLCLANTTLGFTPDGSAAYSPEPRLYGGQSTVSVRIGARLVQEARASDLTCASTMDSAFQAASTGEVLRRTLSMQALMTLCASAELSRFPSTERALGELLEQFSNEVASSAGLDQGWYTQGIAGLLGAVGSIANSGKDARIGLASLAWQKNRKLTREEWKLLARWHPNAVRLCQLSERLQARVQFDHYWAFHLAHRQPGGETIYEVACYACPTDCRVDRLWHRFDDMVEMVRRSPDLAAS